MISFAEKLVVERNETTQAPIIANDAAAEWKPKPPQSRAHCLPTPVQRRFQRHVSVVGSELNTSRFDECNEPAIKMQECCIVKDSSLLVRSFKQKGNYMRRSSRAEEFADAGTLALLVALVSDTTACARIAYILSYCNHETNAAPILGP
jgi:hypothetical protein